MSAAAVSGSVVRVRKSGPLHGSVAAPPDLEVANRALVLAALANGSSALAIARDGARAMPLIAALSAMGAKIEAGDLRVTVQGVGVDGLQLPAGALACARSWDSFAICAGLLAGQRFGTRISVDPALATRDARSIIGPLRARGAQIAGRREANSERELPPLSVAPLLPEEKLLGLRCELPVPDAAAKTAVLISALFSPHETTLAEPYVSADHTERAFVALGIPLRRVGAVLQVDPSDWDRRIPARADVHVPGCTTCASYLIAAALLVPESRIAIANVGINPSRSGFLDALRLWGAPLRVIPRGDAADREPIADVIVQHGGLRGGVLGGELLLRAQGELPALASLAANTQRGAQIYDLALAALPTDPDAHQLEALLHAFGLSTQRDAASLSIVPTRERRAVPAPERRVVEAHESAELAMAALVLGLTAEGETVVQHGADALALTHPGFVSALRELGADLEIA